MHPLNVRCLSPFRILHGWLCHALVSSGLRIGVRWSWRIVHLAGVVVAWVVQSLRTDGQENDLFCQVQLWTGGRSSQQVRCRAR